MNFVVKSYVNVDPKSSCENGAWLTLTTSCAWRLTSQISTDQRNQNLKLNSCSFQLVDSATAFPLKIECQIRVFYAWESV